MNKPLIILVPDSKGWAFDNRCDAMIRYLSDYYTFKKVYINEMKSYGSYKDVDLIYYPGYFQIGSANDSAYKEITKEQRVTSVSGWVRYSLNQAISFTDQSIACSVLNHHFENRIRGKTKSKVYFIPNGVDEVLFPLMPNPNNKVFTVGWAGNDLHNGKRAGEIKRVIDTMTDVNLITQTKRNFIPHDQMPEFYRKLDCYCSVSVSEGCNNPLLEASACGIPLISTRTGIASDLIGRDAGLLLKDDLSDLKSAIEKVMEMDREKISKILRERIMADFTWEKTTMKYKSMFDYALGVENV